jgi:DNA-binding transcriptional LysR family regulator
MAKALPPLTWFRAFDSAARHLNFTAAADELGLTQSAVSQHVRSLELRLGAPLFVRKPRGLALTDDGRRLVPDGAAARARLQAAAEAFGPGAGPGLVSIATSVSLAQFFLVPGLPGLRALHPELRIRLVTTVWPDDFTASNADIELRFGTAEVAGAGGARLLGSKRLIVVARPELAGGTWTERLQQPLIQPVGITQTWEKLARRLGHGAAVPEPAYFVDSHGLAVDLALSGAGLALTSAVIAAPQLASGALVQIPSPEIPGDEGYYVAQRPAATRTPEAAEQTRLADVVLDWLEERVSRALHVLEPASGPDASEGETE